MELSISVKCADCGSDLEATQPNVLCSIVVDPCEKCVDKAADEARSEGFEQGQLDMASSIPPTPES